MSKQNIEVMFFLPAFGGGGIEKVVEVVTENLGERFQCTIVAQTLIDQRFIHDCFNRSKVLSLSNNKSSQKHIYLLYHIYKMYKIIKQVGPDVIISTYPRTDIIIGVVLKLLNRQRRPKWIISSHGEPEGYLGGHRIVKRAKTQLLRLLAKESAEFIAVSDNTAHKWSEIYETAQFKIIGNPIDIGLLNEMASDKEVVPSALMQGGRSIVSVGRLVTGKGFSILIRAFSMVKSDFPDVKLIIIGEGPQRKELEELISELKIEDACFLPGYSLNPHSYVSSATLFAFPSFAEGQPMALGEAVLLGIPVLTSRIAAVASWLEEGHDVLMAEPGNVEEWSKNLLYALSNPELLKGMIENAQEKARRRFDTTIITKQYQDLIDGVMNNE